MTEPQLKLIRLCSHVRTEQFKCGNPVFDFNLRNYQSRFISGDETYVFVLETQMREVVGYISVYDLVREANGRTMRWFCVPAFAVAEGKQGTNYAARLANHVYKIVKLRQSVHLEKTGRPRYDAIACANWTSEIEKALDRLGFQPRPEDIGQHPCWWIRSVERSGKPARKRAMTPR